MKNTSNNLTVMRSYRCNSTLAELLKEVSNRLHVNESALSRMAIAAGMRQIVSKHLTKIDAIVDYTGDDR